MEEFLFALEADGLHLDGPADKVPLYCALARFHRECTLSEVFMETKALIRRSPPIELISETKESISWCGMTGHFVRKTAALQRLHDDICGDQLQRGAVPVDPDLIGEGYRPYVADRGDRCLPVRARHISHYVTLYKRTEKLGTLLAHQHIKLAG